MASRAARVCAWLILGGVISAPSAMAQGLVGGAPTDQQVADDTIAVAAADEATAADAASGQQAEPYGREKFVYPESPDRRDPFAPLAAGEEIGPRFADLELSGLIYAPDVGSVAVLTDRTTLRRYRVREGDWLGDARVDRIRVDEVAFTVAGFGLSRTEVLRVAREDQE